MNIKCELCGKQSQLDFNCLLPIGMLSADICFDCMEGAESDVEVCIKILEHRIRSKGWVPPVEAKLIMSILQKPS